MRNFYLVQAGCLYGDTYYLPYAVGMLAAFALNDEAVKSEYRLGRIVYTLEDIESAIASFENPVLVGFSNSIWNYEYNLEFAKRLKALYPDCIIEFGGHHIPPDTSYLEKYSFVYILTHGKGEESFRDILLGLLGEKEIENIPNISYRTKTGEIIKNNTGVKYSRTITNTDSFDLQSNLYRFNPNVYHVLEYDRMMEMGKSFLEAKTDKPQIFYIWGHSFEMDYAPDYWSRLEEFFKLISGKDDIFYGTNSEVLLDV